MPIDTAADRRSAAGVPFLPVGPGVTPDAAEPLAWRQQSAWGYSGIPVGAPVEVIPGREVCLAGSDTPALLAGTDTTAALTGRDRGQTTIAAGEMDC